MRLPSCLALACILLLCASCGDSRGTGGLQLSEDGATFDTAAAAKRKAERLITRSVADEVGVTWRCAATIAEEPAWNDTDERWYWQAVTATVTLAGSGPAPDEAELRRAVAGYLAKRQRPGSPPPAVAVQVVRQDAAAPAPVAVAAAAPAGGWRYILQAGDTPAQLSSAFYGSCVHWRRIADANPGLLDGQLPVGASIVIPPAP
jgi:nucleoid-associated protein YgaU